MQEFCWWWESWSSNLQQLGIHIHQSWSSQHWGIAMGILGLVLSGAAVVVPVDGDVGMLGMIQQGIWCLSWFQANTHSVWLCFGTCWLSYVLHVLLGGSSPFLMEEWWEIHLKGWGHLQLWGCFCGHGLGIEHMGHHWYHLTNLWWLSQQGSVGVGHLGWESRTQFSCQAWCAHDWWWCLEVSLEPWGVHSKNRSILYGDIIGLESEQYSL